jgi:hypothetical protein
MYHDLLRAVDNNQVTVVVMVDLSAAFNTIDIPIPITILENHFGIKGTHLNWIKSYLTNRSMKVTINNCCSETESLRYGVPQGSCAGPVIFTMYIAALNKVVQKYPADLYGYADDHKLAFKIQAGNLQHETSVLQQLGDCVKDVIEWMNRLKLKMNSSKTQVIKYVSKQQLSKINISSVDIGGCQIRCVDHVRDLGVHMISTLNFEDHIRKRLMYS